MPLTALMEFLAASGAGLFAGAAIYISLVQHPASLQLGGRFPADFFPPMYRRAAPLQASLAVLSSLAAVLAWFADSGTLWLIGALFIGSVVPYTVFVIKPVNDQLLSGELDPTGPDVNELLRRWGRLHWVRSICSLAGFVLFLSGLL